MPLSLESGLLRILRWRVGWSAVKLTFGDLSIGCRRLEKMLKKHYLKTTNLHLSGDPKKVLLFDQV